MLKVMKNKWTGTMFALLLLLFLFCLPLLDGHAKDGVVKEHTNPPPQISFSYRGLDSAGNFDLPEKASFWQSTHSYDKNGIIHFTNAAGEAFYNPSSVAMQAIPHLPLSSPKSLRYERRISCGELYADETALAAKHLRALRWLDENAVALPNGASTWYYHYPLNYNNMIVTSAWSSAFSQNLAICAYITAYRISGDDAYLQKAAAAGLAFDLPVEQGGLKSDIGGLPFFEELGLPGNKSPHILNGHLQSLVMLWRLHKETGEEIFRTLFERGVMLLKKLLPIFDQGYWTRYDLAPRFHRVPLQLTLAGEQSARIKSVKIIAAEGKSQSFSIDAELARGETGNIAWGEGWGGYSPEGRELHGERAFLQVYLPTENVHNWLADTDYTVEIVHDLPAADAPLLSILGFRQGLREYYKVPRAGSEAQADGHGTRTRYILSPRELQWSDLQEHYQLWHTQLMAELARITADDTLFTTTLRWKNYLASYREDKHRQADALVDAIARRLQSPADDGLDGKALRQAVAGVVSLLPRQRVFEPRANAYLDGEIARAFRGISLDLLDQKLSAEILVRYVYFRMQAADSAHSTDVNAILKSAAGSSLHFALVYARLARRAGLAARVWEIDGLPDAGRHVTTEVKINGEWVLMDPYYGFYLSDAKGRALGVAALVASLGGNTKLWRLAGHQEFKRGSAPPPLASDASAVDLSKLYVALDENALPEFNPARVFSNGKLSLRPASAAQTSGESK